MPDPSGGTVFRYHKNDRPREHTALGKPVARRACGPSLHRATIGREHLLHNRMFCYHPDLKLNTKANDRLIERADPTKD